MNERELERVMRDFTGQRANLLLYTTIIETGIDNPHANTIIINRADKFGLAQLHQLRGRVGRSHHQAYAYLLTQGGHDEKSGLTKQAKQRLEAIQMMDELGAGFISPCMILKSAARAKSSARTSPAKHTGSRLQSLYRDAQSRRLGAAPREGARSRPAARDRHRDQSAHPALLPNDYAPDVHERLSLYKRLANCDALEDITAMQEELVDRFGELPLQARSLLESHRLRLLCKPLGIIKLDATAEQLVVQFEANPPIEPIRIIQLIQKRPELSAGRTR